MGWIASDWGVSAALLVGAVLTLVGRGLAWPWLARIGGIGGVAAGRPEAVRRRGGPRLTVARRR